MVTIEEALAALARPRPEPFRQVAWTHADYAAEAEWNRDRKEALEVARAQQAKP